jgi:hypothetical protein
MDIVLYAMESRGHTKYERPSNNELGTFYPTLGKIPRTVHYINHLDSGMSTYTCSKVA